MRQEHYDRVVKWDRRAAYPHLSTVEMRPQVTGMDVFWSLRHVGMKPESRTGAWTALYRRTGHSPQMHRSEKSVASWRLREGDYVGLSVKRTAKEAMSFRETRVVRVIPQFRPFQGYSMSEIDARSGVCTLPILNPLAFSALESYYELLVPRCSEPGLSVTIHTNAAAGRSSPMNQVQVQGQSQTGRRTGVEGRQLPPVNSGEVRGRALRLLTGLGVPFRGA
jgi:ribosomal protein L5